MRDIAVTVVVPVRNEETNIRSCIASLRRFERVIVVDSNSSDRTAEISIEEGAEVVQFSWDRQSVKKRNWVLRSGMILTPWVLFLDADERVSDALADEMQSILPTAPEDGFWIHYSNHFMGRELRFGDPMRKLSLVRRGKAEFELLNVGLSSVLDMEVHEHLIVQGSVGRLRAKIIHNDDKGLDAWLIRHMEYARWEVDRYCGPPVPEATFRQRVKKRLGGSLALPLAYFVYCYFIRLGFLDGRSGLHYAIAKFTYFAQIALRIAERKGRLT